MDLVAKKSYRIRYSKLSKLTKSTRIVYRLDSCFLDKLKGRDSGLFLELNVASAPVLPRLWFSFGHQSSSPKVRLASYSHIINNNIISLQV